MPAIEDIGKLETFPSRKKIGKWRYADLPYDNKKSTGERRVYHQELVMVIEIRFHLPMEFVIIKTEALANFDSLNLVFDTLGVDIHAFQHGLRYGTRWKKIRETDELVEIQRIP